MTYSEALAWLYSTQYHGIKLGLESVQRLLKETGFSVHHDQKLIHVAGTNGKGSVCAMLDSICRAQGLRTGLYTSPHLVEFRERIRVNGRMISEETTAEGLTKIREMVAKWEFSPTFFEITTVLALNYFQSCEPSPDVIILETGMGGRLDATNAVTPSVSVITPIDLDHQAYLGDTLAAIAGEKAGIIKPGIPAVSSTQPNEAGRVLTDAARRQSAFLEFIENPMEGFEIGLAGSHQLENAALAIRALELGRIEASPEAIRNGLRNVRWPGRFQRIQHAGTELILDGAHNRSAAEVLLDTWRSSFGSQKATVILGMARDKDADAICHAVAPIADRLIATPVRSERSCTAQEVLAAFGRVDGGGIVPVESASDFPAAFAAAHGSRRILITGSLFLVGEALAFLEGTQTRISSQ